MAFFSFPQATAFALSSLFFLVLLQTPVSSERPRRWKPRQNSQYHREQDENDENSFRISVANMTCDFFEQPLQHFDLPRGLSPKFSQRYCTYDDFMVNASEAPVFFYTGNESPLEEYINNSGLIWESAAHFKAQVVFMEHRYEGESMPDPGIPNCMAYSSSIQALADFANFIERHLFLSNDGGDNDNTSAPRRPVIAFGGSYGGMLSAWLRMKYPNIVAGAIAGSAPIWGLPRTVPTKIDTAWQVVHRGLELALPPMDPKPDNNHCVSNLLATWPLIQHLANSTRGKALLTETFRLCEPLEQVDSLLEWAQSPWFDLAESSFPYPSSYVVYALTHNDRVKLPAWPLQAACWNASRLHEDWGIRFDGNVSDVRYSVSYGGSGPRLAVDWDKVSSFPTDDENDWVLNPAVVGLLSSVRDAVSLWFNITQDVQCYDVSSSAPNTAPLAQDILTKVPNVSPPLRGYAKDQRQLQKSDNATEQCRQRMATSGSWPALNCNEEMNLIITEAQGLGRDYIWPPSHPRGTRTHADVIASGYDDYVDSDFCADPDGIFGFPQTSPDPWSTWFDTYYGGLSIQGASNIVFSNGLLDPWSAAGVYAAGMDPTVPPGDDAGDGSERSLWQEPVPGLYVQNITKGSSSMIALIMAYGGHHTDLMFSSDLDPPDIREARRIEKQYIQRWIDEWRNQQQQHSVEVPL
jgi:pimeloyl-ACP methyl ester carboxylesterase